MSQYLFGQLDFARTALLAAVQGIGEEDAKKVPAGFNNNILWNLGHVYGALERFAFHFVQEPMEFPEGFNKFFGSGTKPADWEGEPPSLTTVVELLKAQPVRVREKLQNRMHEPLAEPFAIRSQKFANVAEILTFSLFHEGMHVQQVRNIRKLIEQ